MTAHPPVLDPTLQPLLGSSDTRPDADLWRTGRPHSGPGGAQ